ncbi:hypothetical protein QNH20_02245 [Neobacillus sp. WH10]|uniref:hypothetical protein n=1 Tax=Neobacillus sp. WH10 TaxID=3047873 RepID=UPI0024C13760|nr:hypothetical protein [Neobacillus sp. WH10]WHY78010.1 hypothetical protein QNH20_02245 [Neobacillus sp. WH10]
MEPIIIDYTIPMQSEERVIEINQSFGTEFKDTSWHIENLIEQLMPSRNVVSRAERMKGTPFK